MPDDYYVSKYSGEEIDERLTAAHNAVRYDAAQTLTDAQKTQARANIAAAPDGFGLGTGAVPIDDYNNAVNNGWYRGGTNYPSKINNAVYGMVRVDSVGQIKFQTFYAGETGNAMISPFMAIRKSGDYGATWSEWEYVNPPMQLGVEYRTTERYRGKPVYQKLIDFGALPNKTQKSVSIFAQGETNTMECGIDVKLISNENQAYKQLDDVTVQVLQNGKVTLKTTYDESSVIVYVLCYYTKTTD